MSTSQPTSQEHRRPFKPAKPLPWLIKAARGLVRAELSFLNKLHLLDRDLEHLSAIPKGVGVSLTSNHADETDPRVIIELSRRSGKRFISMCNREAFDENFGLAGWALQGLGYFSVERGAHDSKAKYYAIDVIKSSEDVLVIFPEGEIFYMNELVQPFHSGAIDLSMLAILDKRKTDPNWTSYIVPMAIKYHYDKSVEPILEKRIARLESHLLLKPGEMSLPERLHAVQKTLIEREEKIHRVEMDATSAVDLQDEIVSARRKIYQEIAEKYHEPENDPRRTIDKSWKLGAELREKLEEQADLQEKVAIEKDIATLQEVAQLASWNPQYYEGTGSIDRMAEALIKLERETFRIKRPPQLTSRNVFVRIAKPVDLAPYVEEYTKDAHAVRKQLTDHLQSKIQSLLDELTEKTSAS